MLKNYSGHDLQNVKAIISTAILNGTIDCNSVIATIDTELQGRFAPFDAVSNKAKRKEICPECGSLNWIKGVKREGILYDACPDCRYSRMVR